MKKTDLTNYPLKIFSILFGISLIFCGKASELKGIYFWTPFLLLVVTCLVIAFVYLSGNGKSFKTPFLFLILAFSFFIPLLSAIFSGAGEPVEGFLKALIPLIIFILGAQLDTGEVKNIILIPALTLSVYTIYQYLGRGAHPFFELLGRTNANFFYPEAPVPVFIGGGILLYFTGLSRNNLTKWLSLGALALIGFSIYTCGSYSGIVVIMFSFILLSFLLKDKLINKLLPLASLLILPLLFYISKYEPKIQGDLSQFPSSYYTGYATQTKEKIHIWEDSLKLSMENFVLGYGPESFGEVYPIKQSTPLKAKYAHSYLLNTMVETGWFSALCLILIFLFLGCKVFLTTETEFKVMCLLSFSILLYSFYNLCAHTFAFFSFAYLPIGYVFSNKEKKAGKIWAIPFVLITILTVLSLLSEHIAFSATKLQNLKKLKSALILNPLNYSAKKSLILIALKRGNPSLAEAEAEKMVESKPLVFTYHFLLGKVQEKMKKIPLAISSYKRTVELNPFFVDGYISIAFASRIIKTEKKLYPFLKKKIKRFINVPIKLNAYFVNLPILFWQMGDLALISQDLESASLYYMKARGYLTQLLTTKRNYRKYISYDTKKIEGVIIKRIETLKKLSGGK